MFKFGLGYVAKLPRFFIFISFFITMFLLVFLFLACIDTASAFSDIYLVKYSYNQDSAFYKDIADTFKYRNASGLAEMQIQSGFLSICAGTGDSDLTCVPRHNTTALNKFIPVTVNTPDDKNQSTVDPLALAAKFSTASVNPYFIILTLVLLFIAMIATLWGASERLPKQELISSMAFGTTVMAWISWTVGAIWLEVACNTVTDVVPDASATVLTVNKGSRATGMSWAAFTFLLIAMLLAMLIRFKQRRAQRAAVDKV